MIFLQRSTWSTKHSLGGSGSFLFLFVFCTQKASDAVCVAYTGRTFIMKRSIVVRWLTLVPALLSLLPHQSQAACSSIFLRCECAWLQQAYNTTFNTSWPYVITVVSNQTGQLLISLCSSSCCEYSRFHIKIEHSTNLPIRSKYRCQLIFNVYFMPFNFNFILQRHLDRLQAGD